MVPTVGNGLTGTATVPTVRTTITGTRPIYFPAATGEGWRVTLVLLQSRTVMQGKL